MPKKINKQVKIGIYLNKRLFRGLVAVLLIGVVGSYFLFGVQAADSPCGQFYSEDECNQFKGKFPPGEIFTHFEEDFDGPLPSNGWQRGERIDMVLRASFTIDSASSTQLVVLLTSDHSRVDYRGYGCGDAGNCTNSAWDKALPPYTYPFRDAVVCIDVAPGAYNWTKLLSIQYRAEKFIPVSSINDGSTQFIAYRGAYASGTCADNKTAAGSMFGSYMSSEGVCGMPGFSACKGGQGPGSQKPGGNQNDNGDVSGKDGDGQGSGSGGGGGGGSSANTQNDKPNTTPSTSNQGKNKQPDLSPSPFYDGRQYDPGSTPDNIVIGAISSAGNAVTRNWQVTLGVLTLVGTGSIVIWKKYNKELAKLWPRERSSRKK